MLNTSRAVENPTTGEIVWRWDSAPFGETAAEEDPDGDSIPFTLPLRFPGQYLDAETGLHYNYCRDYEPRTGRYVQSDPIGLRGGSNAYSYVASDPISYLDLFGLVACDGKWVKWDEHVPVLPGPGWTQLPSPICKCFWMCLPCVGGVAWSGNPYSLETTTGYTIVDFSTAKRPNAGSAGLRPTPQGPARGPSGAAGGSYTCVCKKPSDETRAGWRCDACYPDSNFPGS